MPNTNLALGSRECGIRTPNSRLENEENGELKKKREEKEKSKEKSKEVKKELAIKRPKGKVVCSYIVAMS